MRHVMLLVLCVAGSVVGGFLRAAWTSPAEITAERSSAPLSEEQSQEIRRELLRLRRTVDAQGRALVARAESDGPSAPPGQGNPATTQDQEPRRPSREEMEEHDRQAYQRFNASLEAQFGAQYPDAQFEKGVAPRLLAAVKTLPAGVVQAQQVECRAQICKTTLTHSAPLPSDALYAFSRADGSLEHFLVASNGQTTVYSREPGDSASEP